MKAIILAAGIGNRMRPLTDTTHKTLLPIGGQTIIKRIIDSLLDHKIYDIMVVTGYRKNELTTYCTSTFPNAKFTFINNDRYRETNNIYSMALAFNAEPINDDILLIESDLVYDAAILDRIISSPFETVALVDKYKTGMDGTVVTVVNNIITSVIPPHLQNEKFDFSDKYKTLNIYKFSQRFCEASFKKLLTWYANTLDANCYYELILGILIYMHHETVHAEIVGTEAWAEVDDPNDLHVAEFTIHENRKNILADAFGGYWNYDILDFCFIRNMYFPTHAMISELKNSLAELIHNYGSRQEILNRKLSWFLLCHETRVHLLNGAAQIYPILKRLFAGKKALIPEPTFGEYPRIFPHHAVYHDTIGFTIQDIENQIEEIDVIVIVNPNNPTGTWILSQDIYSCASRHPDVTFIVDESFIEFTESTSLLLLLEGQPLNNVVIVKSLSKSLGVPGIRLGYIYSSNQEIIAYTARETPIWNSNSLAEFFLKMLLKNRTTLAKSFVETIRDREIFRNELSALALVDTVYPSGANFICLRLKKNADFAIYLVESLLSNSNIYIKDVSNKFSDGFGYLRLAVRLPKENIRLVEHLRILGDQ